MAKDKAAKSGKGEKPEKSKGKSSVTSDEFGKPSEAPAGGDGWKFASPETLGKLMLITPLREEDQKAYGKAGERGEKQPVIVADVVVINEKKPEKSEGHEGVWIFQRWIQGALRGYIGERRVLGRLEQDEDKSQGDRPAWILVDPTKPEIAAAKAYLATLDPFSTTKGGDEKPGKKSKKK